MTGQRVTATYSAPLVFQSTDLWEQVRSAIVAQLPLRNLHWKSASRSSIRTVQELHIDLVPYETTGREDHASQVPGSILEKPLLNVYIVACEDAEVYRTTIKKQIKDWHTPIVQRKNQEWLIVHIVSPDSRVAPGTFLKMKGTVIDKIRADFNVDKRDRCIQLAWSADKDHPAAWVDLITKMKEGILTAFDSVVSQREEEVKRSEGQRQMPGWNFCTFFILKESLATLFEGMGLFDDALAQFDELESTFNQVLREKNLSWFGSLISPSPKDDSQSLLSLNKKPYRDLILANTISIFDFRIYLLARQCTVLAGMGRLVEAAKKSSSFLASFSRRLREVEGQLPKFFIESWVYSSALSVVEQCDIWAGPFEFDKATLPNYQAAKGELLQLAANQLDTIGISAGHLPPTIPFSMSLPLPAPGGPHEVSQKRASRGVTKADIVSAIADKDVFYDLYINVTKRAIDLYAKAGRRQFALKLHGTLAALDVHRARLAKAHQTYSSLPGHYIPHGWTSIGCYMHYQAVDIHSKLEKPRDREWIHVILDFLKAYVADLSQEFLMEDEDKIEYISGLTDMLREAANDLDSDVPYPDHPAIHLKVHNTHTEPAGNRDGCLLAAIIENKLPSPIFIDEIKVVLFGADSERMIFSGQGTLLPPGATSVALFCPNQSSTFGPFLLEKSEVRVSKILLQWNHKNKHSHSRLVKELPKVINVSKDPEALDITISQPRSIELGATQRVHVAVLTGRNDVSEMKIQFASHTGIKFRYSGVEFDGEDPDTESTEEWLTIKGVPKDSSISFLLPHSDASGYNAIKVNVKIDYMSVSEPSIVRSLRLSRVVPTSLAIAVNVEDFFRGKSLFTRFTISTTTHQHVRIRSAQLEVAGESQDDLKIFSCIGQKNQLITATPSQPGHYLFRLESSRGKVLDPLRLRITYRVFRKEVEAVIEHAVDEVLTNSPELLPQRKVLVENLVKALESDAKWVSLYGVTGQLDAPMVDQLEGELGVALRNIRELLLKNDPKSFDYENTWKEIIFPVDVPQMNIIAAVRVGIMSKNSQKRPTLYAGQPMSAIVSIRTSFHWGPGGGISKTDKSYTMRFDVEELLKDWLVSGQKRGDFVAKDGETFTVPITLVALHHGELTLPRASVTPLPSVGGEVTMGSVVLPSCDTYQEHGAEKVLVLPRGGRSTFLVGMGGT